MYTAAHPPKRHMCPLPLLEDETEEEDGIGLVDALLDSGAFTDPPTRRLTYAGALERQLRWEERAARLWERPRWHVRGLVSYDLLIDETWVGATKYKRRWSLHDAAWAITQTVEAARYLALQRALVAPRRLILSCQGVDPQQYTQCAQEVLSVARPGDWLGLGGWCIMGRQQSLLPAFEETLHAVLPLVRAAGLTHVHLFGVLWLPALGRLLWLADACGLTASTDSTTPIMAASRGDPKKAGMRGETWQQNLAYWRHTVAKLRDSSYYVRPRNHTSARQLAWAFGREGAADESA